MAEGGGIYSNAGTVVIQSGSQVTGNSTALSGGGIFAAAANLTVDNATVGTSTADNGGGGIWTSGTTTIQNGAQITGNSASTNGGGIFNNAAGGLSFADSTLTGNSAVNLGGGIFNDGGLTLSGTATTLDVNTPDTIAGSGNVTSSPTGIVTFATGTTSTYTGTTTLTSGTTLVNGTLDNTGGTVTVQTGATLGGTGTVARSVSVQSGGIIAPGTGLGILNAGNTTFLAGSNFNVEVNGVTTAGTDYDQLNVTGTVDVTGAVLNTSGTVTGTMAGDAAVIINNDGTDPVVGTFAGLADGATVNINGEVFHIYYNGGDGNDVVLAAAPALVNAVYVNDDFTGTNGTIIADADPNTPGNQMAVIGENAFSTIQAGVNAVSDSGTVSITDDLSTDGPGTYNENVTINKPVTIQATEGDPSAVIVDGGAAGSVFTIAAGNTVTLDSMTIQNGSAANGGGINNAGNLTLTNSLVQNNSASANGGGISNSGTLTVDNSTIGQFLVENDVWSQTGAAGDLVFAFVDAQNSTASQDVLLDVLENDGSTVIDNFNSGISAGGSVTQGGNVFYNVQSNPFGGGEVTPYQIYSSVVDPAAAIAETESNDTSATANPITAETLVTGDLGTATDADYFPSTWRIPILHWW